MLSSFCLLKGVNCVRVWHVTQFPMHHMQIHFHYSSESMYANEHMPAICLMIGGPKHGMCAKNALDCYTILTQSKPGAVGLSVDYDTWPLIHRKPVWLVGLNVDRGYPQLLWIYFARSCYLCKFMPFYKKYTNITFLSLNSRPAIRVMQGDCNTVYNHTMTHRLPRGAEHWKQGTEAVKGLIHRYPKGHTY